MMDSTQRSEALEFHKKARGKIQIFPSVNIRNEQQLAMAYMPGSAPACEEIRNDPVSAYDYTGKGNRIAEISNGSALMGFGNAGPDASIPVLEGKCLLLKLMGDINAIPIALNAPSHEEIVAFCEMIAPSFGGINIEDVRSPDTFYILRELSGCLGVPVFCDDQQGSAIIILAAVKNSLRLLGISIEEARIVVMGAGAAGIASTELLLTAGAKDVIVLDANGILDPASPSLNPLQENLGRRANPRRVSGGLDEALAGADILIGLSRENAVSKEQIKKMNRKPVVLALALPDPEISCKDAKEAGAYIYASGRIEDSNTLLNIHAFPGLVRGALDVRAKQVTESMLLAAADALANMVDRRHLSPEQISPRFFGSERTPRIAEAVGQAAIRDGIALFPVPEGQIYENTWNRLFGEIEHI